jgi:AcrR family transcriptional regulator
MNERGIMNQRALDQNGSRSAGGRRSRPESVDLTSTEDSAFRLVLVAARLFNEDGIHATGINRIIAEAGVARMTLYNHFGSKEGLIRAVMDRESKAWFEWLDSELARVEDKGAEARIAAFFALLGQWFSRSDFKGCSFINAVGEHPLDNCVRPIAKAHRQANFEYIRRLIEDSGVQDLDRVANQIAILADGATVTAMVTGDPGMADDAAAAALALLDIPSSAGRGSRPRLKTSRLVKRTAGRTTR